MADRPQTPKEPVSASPASGERLVPAELSGHMLDSAVRTLFGLSWGKARTAIERSKVRVDGAILTDALKHVREGQTIALNMNARTPRPTDLPPNSIVHMDAHVVVVRKPAGISTVPFDGTETGTLDERVRAYLTTMASREGKGGGARPSLGVVHRIDKETTGLVVFTRTWLAKEALASQFRAHTVHRRYQAIVHGTMGDFSFRTHLVENRGDGLRGSFEALRNKKSNTPNGQLAITHVTAVERLEGATLVSCRLETGRTHQIRIHLSESGHPLLGERVYIRGYTGNELPAPRLMLHAAELGFVHPATEQEVRFEDPLPKDMEDTLRRLRP